MAGGLLRTWAGPLGVVCWLGVGLGCVPRTPLVLSYDTPGAGSSARERQACHIHFSRILDQRADKIALGTVAGRPVRAPRDTDPWIRAMLTGLADCGVEVSFGKDSPVPARSIPAEAQLVTVWVSSLATSMTANVVMPTNALLPQG